MSSGRGHPTAGLHSRTFDASTHMTLEGAPMLGPLAAQGKPPVRRRETLARKRGAHVFRGCYQPRNSFF